MTENGFDVLGVSSEGKELDDIKKEEGISVCVLNMTRTISPFRDLKSFWQMYRLFVKEKPLIVHSHTPKAGIVSMFAAKLAGVPIRLHTVAGLPLMEARGIKRIILNAVEKLTYTFATKVYPNSNGLYDFILSNKFAPKHKLQVIANGSSNGIDTTHFSTKNITKEQTNNLKINLGILPDDFVYVFVGRLVGDKGINELVIAFAQLKTFNSKLLLVGPFENDLDPLQPETLLEIKNNPNIISVGFQEDVRPFLAISDCFVFPSYREGFPNVVMQAGAMGLPSIVTNINGCNEIIIEGQNGTLIPIKNWKLLKDAMIKMKEDVAWRDSLQANSRSLIINRYKQELVWDFLLKEYKKFLARDKFKLFRTSTVPVSLDYLLKGQLRFLNQYFEVVAVSGEDAHLRTVAEREQVRVVPLTMQRAIRPFHDLVALWRLYWLFRTERPQIVHSITPKAGLLSMLAAKMAGVPVRMHTFTGLIFPSRTGVMQRLLIQMDRLLCWAATHIYPEGNGVQHDLLHYKITSKPLQVLANGNVNGIDLEFFSCGQVSTEQKDQLQQELGLKPNDFVYIFVGRLVGDKGINELISAFSQLETPNSKLLLVGPFEPELDPLQPETLKVIESHPNIISVGFQSDVRPYFAVSDCLVFPSYREGFPNVVMQAGAMGLPSIVTDINGCNEIIVEGENGTIIPVKNVATLVDAMQKMIYDTSYYHHLRQNARPMIQSRYEQRVVWEALLAEYNSLLAQYNSTKG